MARGFWSRFAVLGVGLFCGACAFQTPTSFVGIDGRPTSGVEVSRLTQPDDSVLVIWNHGSRDEHLKDHCPGVPPSIAALSGRRIGGRTVKIYHLCQDHYHSTFDFASGTGVRKISQRVAGMEQVIESFRGRGYRREQIVLAGQSCGAWAGLLLAARRPELFGRQIAFSPACHGMIEQNRQCAGAGSAECAGILRNRRQHIAAIKKGREIRALIYQFEGDKFAPPGSLSFLDGIPGIERVDVEVPPGTDGHLAVWSGLMRPDTLGYAVSYLAVPSPSTVATVAAAPASGGPDT